MMTEQEFIKRCQEVREAYIKDAADFMDACERLDFESAFKHSMAAADILGLDFMAFLGKKYMEADTEEMDDKYEEMVEKVNKVIDTGE